MFVTSVLVIRNARFELTTSRSQTERSTKLSQFRVICQLLTDDYKCIEDAMEHVRFELTSAYVQGKCLPIKLTPQNTTEVLSNMSSKEILINVIAVQSLRS